MTKTPSNGTPASTPQQIGRYRILGRIGRGAMGVVLLAEDTRLERRVALKTLRRSAIDDEERGQEISLRFLREARAAGSLNHPAIVTIFDVDELPEEDLSFIVMEHVAGSDLKSLLREEGRFEPRRAARIVAEIAEGLAFAHEHGIVHRDVKPANVIVTPAGQAKITDFGIARLQSSDLTSEGQSIGTPNYMSPEQILGEAVDHRTDVFALGLMLFELLSGEKPFRGPNVNATWNRVVNEPHESLASRLGPGFAAFDPILDRAMAKSPGKRYDTAADMAADLRRVAAELDPDELAAGEATQMPPAPSETVGADTMLAGPMGVAPARDEATEVEPAEAGAKEGAPAEPTQADQGSTPGVLLQTPEDLVSEAQVPADGGARRSPSYFLVGALLLAAGLLAVLFGLGLTVDRQRTEPAAELSARDVMEKRGHIARATELLDAGRLDEAGAEVEALADLAPASVPARELRQRLEEARVEEARRVRPRTSPAPSPGGAAWLTIRFESPVIARGILVVYLDQEQKMREAFDWRSGFLRKQEKGGEFERGLESTAGEHQIQVHFTDPKRNLSAQTSLSVHLAAGEDRRVVLRLDPDGKQLRVLP